MYKYCQLSPSFFSALDHGNTIFYDSLCSIFTSAITCEDPPKVADAEMFGGGFVFEARVHYTCREGYKMQGPANLACGEQGKWIGEVPVCTGTFELYLNQYFRKFCVFKMLVVFK